MTYSPQNPTGPTQQLRKPVSVGVVQTAVALITIATPALYFLLMQRLVGLMADREPWGLNDPGDTPETLARGEFLYALVTVYALPAVLAVLALLSAIGLQKRRRWARILTAIWVGVMLLPLAAWAAGAAILWKRVPAPTGTKEYFLGPADPIMLNALAAPIAFLSALIVFILIFRRSVRNWAPKRSAAPQVQNFPQFSGPLSYVPQTGYTPHGGYGQLQQGSPIHQEQRPVGPTEPRS
jgi:hypothetical protein